MKIGLLFGSFNPVHVGHLIIANYFREFTDIEQVWFVVSPQSPFKADNELAPENDRVEMVRLAINGTEGYRVCDIELNLPRPSYTYRTLQAFRQQFPEYEFVLIMGGDNLVSFHKWKQADWIASEFDLYVYPRPGYNADYVSFPRLRIVQAPLLEISATFIRRAISEGKQPWFFLHPRVAEYIKSKGLYGHKA